MILVLMLMIVLVVRIKLIEKVIMITTDKRNHNSTSKNNHHKYNNDNYENNNYAMDKNFQNVSRTQLSTWEAGHSTIFCHI